MIFRINRWFFTLLVIVVFPAFFMHCGKDDDDSPTVKDIDGNVYTKLRIGNQVWLKENLKVTRFNNGDEIPDRKNDMPWKNAESAAYCHYENNSDYNPDFGKLYNFYAVFLDDLCPNGYHVPTLEEWNALITFLGGESAAGGKMKETGTENWIDPNTGATNESNFTALPGGLRSHEAAFSAFGITGYFWSSSISDPGKAHAISLHESSAGITYESLFQKHGLSVRCIKN